MYLYMKILIMVIMMWMSRMRTWLHCYCNWKILHLRTTGMLVLMI
ncbi:unnamed protein product [Amoebophrya sp. A25]|nr:unnamed protein product [Amoebophrya sp. A25]|eukprot:GSA25T00026579001.1